MNALTILALVLAIPVLLIPVAFVWYINIGGIVAAIREVRIKRAVRKTTEKVDV